MRISSVATSIVMAALSVSAVAQVQQNNVKLGVIYYTTDSQTGGLHIEPPTAGAALSGSDVVTGNATTLLFAYERMFSPNIGAELVLGVPPRITGSATGPLAGVLQQAGISADVLSARNVAPTLLLNYHFFEESSKWRPYVGAGINYTYFSSIESSIPGAQIEMSDSWGWAVQGGISYAASKQWGLFASIARVDVKSDVKAVASLPGIPVPLTVTTSVDFKPITYAAGLWYAF